MHKRTIQNSVVLFSLLWLGFRLGGLLGAPPDTELARKVTPTDSPVSPQTLEVANALSNAFRSVAKHVLPAVVSIENRINVDWQESEDRKPSRRENPFKGTPFEDFFDDRYWEMPLPPRAPQAGIGSGVIIDASGVVLTNNHVVAGAGKVIVRTQDGREFVATEVLTDPQTDIAVVRITSEKPLVAATLGDSDRVEVGDWVVALGQPFGLESTMTAGIISAKNRGIGIADRENFIQTDAAINPGNSGGPLVNLRGEVIGINTAISSRDGGNSGVGFAVPSSLAKWVSSQLILTGKVHRSYLGIGIQLLTSELAAQLGVEPRSGVAVSNVVANTPASKMGLQIGDVIVKFGGLSVTTPQQLQLAVERVAAGKSVSVDIIRDGKSMALMYQAEEAPSDFQPQKSKSRAADQRGFKIESLGIELRPLNQDVAKQLGVEGQTGLVITAVRPGSVSDRAGLQSGMVVVQVNRKAVTTVDEFEEIVQADADGRLLLLIRTQEGTRFVVIGE